MFVKNATIDDIVRAIDASPDNLRVRNIEPHPKKNGVNVTLGVKDSYGLFARIGFAGSHLASACYHGHYEFMLNLLRANPTFMVQSAMGTYKGLEDFLATADNVANISIGKVEGKRMAYGEMCECRRN